jgi:tetratricopeptide (TPR) repeat protein
MKKRTVELMVALAGAAAVVMAQAPQPPPTVVVPKGTKGLSPKEAAAIKKIQDAKSADETIAAVENLITNFADTSFKAAALYVAAEASDSKQDYIKAISYGELSIEADPKGVDGVNSMLLVSGEIAQHTGKNDLDKEAKLTKAEKYANQALEMIPTLTKPEAAKVSDSDWAALKKEKTADGHRDLGLIAKARGKWDVASTEFKAALDGQKTPDLVVMVRLGNAYNEGGKFADAKAILQKVVDASDVNPQVKAAAEAELNRADRGLKTSAAK